jgi:hypothetical protein
MEIKSIKHRFLYEVCYKPNTTDSIKYVPNQNYVFFYLLNHYFLNPNLRDYEINTIFEKVFFSKWPFLFLCLFLFLEVAF